MHVSIEQHRDQIADICRRYAVRRLEVFGSAARGTDFNPETSDADFLVEFEPENGMAFLNRFFGLSEALAGLLGRPVDLVEPRAIRNPYIRASYRSGARGCLWIVTVEAIYGICGRCYLFGSAPYRVRGREPVSGAHRGSLETRQRLAGDLGIG